MVHKYIEIPDQPIVTTSKACHSFTLRYLDDLNGGGDSPNSRPKFLKRALWGGGHRIRREHRQEDTGQTWMDLLREKITVLH